MMWRLALASVVGLLAVSSIGTSHAAAWIGVAPGVYQFIDVGPDTNCITGFSAAPQEGGARVCYAPNLASPLYADPNCASGWITFMVARGARICYVPDAVAENSDLQDRCPSHPNLYVCPD